MVRFLFLLICLNCFSQEDFVSDGYPVTNGFLDVNQIILDLPNREGLSLGNGCGGLGGDYAIIETPEGLELDGLSNLTIMWLQLTINGSITDFGETKDVLDLMFEGRISLFCPVSEDYENESTIIVLDETLSIPEASMDEIRMFPNPASNEVTIQGKGLKNIQCFDLLGRKIFEIKQPIEINKMYLFNYKSGTYIILLEDQNGNKDSKKLVIK